MGAILAQGGCSIGMVVRYVDAHVPRFVYFYNNEPQLVQVNLEPFTVASLISKCYFKI